MKVLKVALNGASGKMGREITKLAKESGKIEICASLDQRITTEEFDLYTRLQELHKRSPQVIIDFSQPKGTMEILSWCLKYKMPLVIGTTGFSAKDINKINLAAKKIPIFMSPNMSLGVHAMTKALETFLKNYGSCEVEIEEIHHTQKKDKPSGTAKHLKQALDAAGSTSKNKLQKIGTPISLRGGEVYGIHKVYFFGTGEWHSFEHHAQGRKVFASGAIDASHWIVGQKPGLYGMKDLVER